MNAKKIAIVLQTPRDQHSSVLLTYEDLAGELTRLGHQVAILTAADFPVTRRAGRWMPLVYPVVVARWVRRHARECDLAVFHSYAGWLAVGAAAARGVPSVVAFHGVEPMYHRQLIDEMERSGGLSWRYRWLQERLMPVFLRRACRRAALVTCLNAAEREYLVSRGWVAAQRIATVAHGVSDEFFVAERPARPARTLLFVGQWLPMKGVDCLRQAFEELARRHSDLRLICAGTLRGRDEILSGFSSDEIRARVTVLPRLDRAPLAAVFRDADIFVFPSSYEGFGVAILEAMAARLPIVTTPVGVAADALEDGQSAVVVPLRDSHAIVRAVERLIADDDLRVRIGHAAHVVARQYRSGQTVRSWAHTLTSIAPVS